jgi:hypothetical protein
MLHLSSFIAAHCSLTSGSIASASGGTPLATISLSLAPSPFVPPAQSLLVVTDFPV